MYGIKPIDFVKYMWVGLSNKKKVWYLKSAPSRRAARIWDVSGPVPGHSARIMSEGVNPRNMFERRTWDLVLYIVAVAYKLLILRTSKYYFFSLFLFQENVCNCIQAYWK